MEAKHTEGPWRVSSEIPTAIVADIPQAVDHMKYFGFDDSTPYGGYLIAESVVQPENARLIAAAPEMYNELVIGHGVLLKIMDALPLESPEFKRLQKLLINQAEVIAKATGGQQ